MGLSNCRTDVLGIWYVCKVSDGRMAAWGSQMLGWKCRDLDGNIRI